MNHLIVHEIYLSPCAKMLHLFIDGSIALLLPVRHLHPHARQRETEHWPQRKVLLPSPAVMSKIEKFLGIYSKYHSSIVEIRALVCEIH